MAIKQEDENWLMRPIESITRRGWELSDIRKSTWTDATTIDWETCVPVDMSTRADGITMVTAPTDHSYRRTGPVKEPQTWEQYLSSIPEWEQTLLQKTQESNSTRGLAVELGDPSSIIMIVSDGGAKDDKGYFGWIIGTKYEVL